jgi:CubicO group peptidase (beta-lactamase class C family)
MNAFLAVILSICLVGCQELSFHQGMSDENITRQSSKKEKMVVDHNPQKTIQEMISRFLVTNQINGSVAVLQSSKVIFNKGLGYANIENKTLNKPTTTFPIGSITKTFVATSIMQLQEQGKLNINDPVTKFIAHFPNGNKIKLIHLLTHTSGIQPPIWQKGDTTPVSLVREIKKRPIRFPAGTKWDYKDANYMVLGYIVEKVTGIPLHEYIQKNIFDKVYMKDSGFITPKFLAPYTSIGYTKEGLLLHSTNTFNTYLLYGCGDIYMTAYDLCLYDEALMNGKLVSPKSLKMIRTPGSTSNYGLGLYTYSHAAFSRGVLGGWESLHVYYNDQTSIVLLLNIRNKGTDIYKIAADIHRLLKVPT